MNNKTIVTFLVVSLFLLPSVSTIIADNNNSNAKNTIDTNESGFKKLYLKNLTGCYDITSQRSVDSFQMYCHMPIVCKGQSPVIINDVWTEPVDKVTDFKVADDYSGLNSLLCVNISGMKKGETLKLFWSMNVVIKQNNFEDLPENVQIPPREDLPNDVKKWLLPSDFIQSDHWRIKLRARSLKGFSNNAIKIAKNIADFTGNEITYKGGRAQDALTTLRKGFGVCTGKANLAAALLRANDIPARVLFVHQTHYIIEFYAHPYGWIRMESTTGKIPAYRQNHTVQYIAYPSDETSDNVINGQHPNRGVIAYWGISNNDRRWNFMRWKYNYSSWRSYKSTRIYSNTASVSKAINITEKVWEYYKEYLDADLTNEQRYYFQNATGYQEKAVKCFEQRNFEGYIENMTYSLIEYQKMDEKFQGIAVGADIIGDESSISEITNFVENCNINNVIVDFGWITWSWENTKFSKVEDFIDELKEENITVWLMYRARTLPGDQYGIPYQVHRNGKTDDREISFSSKKSREWAISWSDKLLEKYPKVDGLILYNPRILPDGDYSVHSVLNFMMETKTFGFPRLFRRGTEKYDLWMEWRCEEINEFIVEWKNHVESSYPKLELGAVLLPEVYHSYTVGQDLSRLESSLDVVFPFVALDDVDNTDLAGEICNMTEEKVSRDVVSDIKIYGPYNNTDDDIVDAIESSMQSNGDGFFVWCYDHLDPEKYDLNKIVDAYNGIYN